jgi:hypothetical protein
VGTIICEVGTIMCDIGKYGGEKEAAGCSGSQVRCSILVFNTSIFI